VSGVTASARETDSGHGGFFMLNLMMRCHAVKICCRSGVPEIGKP